MPVSKFEDVFKSEYADIFVRDPNLPKKAAGGNEPAVDNGLVGLALSGGGIRSAAFGLGGLQALNQRGVLEQIHYLSTVSGGGYIGTAMTVGISTGGRAFPFGKSGEDVGETDATKYLRDHSRYLVQNGIRSVLSALVIYLRGITANIVIVLPLLLLVAAAFVWLVPDSHILKAGHGWIAPFDKLPDGFKTLAMPLSLLATGITTVLLVIYAIGVSIFPIIPLRQRGALALVASGVLCIVAVIVLYELHCLLLNATFDKLAAPKHDEVDVFTTLVSLTKALIAVVVASLGGIFPFIKQIAKSAVSDKQAGTSDTLKRWGSRALLFVAAAVMPLLLWLLVMTLIFWGIGFAPECLPAGAANCTWQAVWGHAPEWLQWLIGTTAGKGPPTRLQPWLLYLVAAAVLTFLALLLNVNSNSLHQLYRDRLGSAFLGAFTVSRKIKGKDQDVSADTFALHEIDSTKCPYHLINVALNVPGSEFANRRGRNADFFVFSKNYTGSEMTGYVGTKAIEEVVDGLNIGTAMAISGAAAAPNMGMASMRPLSSTIAFLNVRLGRWLKHPEGVEKLASSSGYWRWQRGTPGPLYLLREAFSKSGFNLRPGGFLFLTDGGHIENLGVYELLRRRCKVIIAIDGEADPDLDGGSLVQLERFARIDLGTSITMDWKAIGAMTRQVSKDVKDRKYDPHPGPHVALGSISYPGATAGTREYGLLVYVKASLSGDENDYIMNYKAAHASFPHETTLDQLFSEEQFECYRALGEHIMRRFLAGQDQASPNAANRADLVKMFNDTVKNMSGQSKPV